MNNIRVLDKANPGYLYLYSLCITYRIMDKVEDLFRNMPLFRFTVLYY
jgi:hypothetical protein